MHAQVAQMRAIETGRWIVRAASTGISGIIAPDGHYRREAPLGQAAIVAGAIGAPVHTAYPALGAPAFAALFACIYGIVLYASRRST